MAYVLVSEANCIKQPEKLFPCLFFFLLFPYSWMRKQGNWLSYYYHSKACNHDNHSAVNLFLQWYSLTNMHGIITMQQWYIAEYLFMHILELKYVYSPTAELSTATVAMVTVKFSQGLSFVSSESVTNCTHTSTRPSPSVTLYCSTSKDISRGTSENWHVGVN